MIFATVFSADSNGNPDVKSRKFIGYDSDIESAKNFVKHNLTKLVKEFKYIVFEDIKPGYKSAIYEKKWYRLTENDLEELEKPFSIKNIACFAVDL